ncbi:MFS transporter [Nocardia sp. NPDC049190]|uniref:MFS transporter n=1 Tax=Nocardia sp. NPDC049190 TaxID=3155650 RepID=UPI0033F33F0B
MILEVFGYYGFGTLAVLVLEHKGFTVVTSLAYLAVGYLGYPLGSLLAIPLMERCERKYLLMASAGLMAVFGLLFGFGASALLIMISGALYTMASNVFSDAIHAYLPESFPTSVRGTAAGATYALAKASTAVLPFVLLPLLNGPNGPALVFTVITVAMLALIAVVAVWGPVTGRRALDAH